MAQGYDRCAHVFEYKRVVVFWTAEIVWTQSRVCNENLTIITDKGGRCGATAVAVLAVRL